MTAWIESLNAHSAGWSTWLWRVCWQGAIVIAIAWLLTVLLRRWSPRLRSWIWRLAYLKLLVLLVWTTPVTLAVLPAEQESSLAAGRAPSLRGSARSAPVENDVPKDATSPFSRDPQGSDAQESDVAAIVGSPSSDDEGGRGKADGGVETATLSLPSLLLLAWSFGLILVVGWLAYETWLAIRLRRSARLVSSPELEALVREVQMQLRIRGNVRLAESESAGGPMLVKFATPVVVFPCGMLAAPSPQPSPVEGEGANKLSKDELRLVLAHELAHVKRHDLAWNALAAVVHAPLYFHPLLWLAHRLARQEQEMACDELVVTRLGVARHEYGRMLVKIVKQMGNSVRTSVAVVGMASSYQTLSRRLRAMQYLQPFGRKQTFVASCAIICLGIVVIVPWRLVAQEAKPIVVDGRSQVMPESSVPGVGPQESTQPSIGLHSVPVRSRNLWTVKFSPEGQLLAGGGVDGTLWLWHRQSGKQHLTVKAHDSRVRLVHFSPDGQSILTAADSVKTWNTSSGELLRTTKLEGLGTNYNDLLAITSDGNKIAGRASHSSNGVVVWDANSGEIKTKIELASMPLAASFSPDGNYLAVGTIALANNANSGSVQVYDPVTAAHVRTINNHFRSISSVAFSPDGRLIAGGDHRGISLWNVENGELQRRLEGHSGVIESIAISSDGKQLVSGAEGPWVRYPNRATLLSESKVWDLEDGRLLASSVGTMGRATGVAFTPDGKWIARCDFRSLVCEEIRGVWSWVKYFEPEN